MLIRKRYYSENDQEVGVTPSQLKRLGKAKQIEYMTYWFHRNYEDPVEETPYESAEGGYIYIWGGPYEAKDELFDEFGSFIAETRIDEAVEEVESDGITDWAPGPEHPSQRERAEDWAADRDDNGDRSAPSADLNTIIHNLQDGQKPTYGDQLDLSLRQKTLDKIEQLTKALIPITPHGGIGHNNPPLDEDLPQIAAIIEVRQASNAIQVELNASEPDALTVATATSRLQKIIGWFGKKADKAADGFATAIGVAVATAVIGGVAYIARHVPGHVEELVTSIVRHATEWLTYVTLPF